MKTFNFSAGSIRHLERADFEQMWCSLSDVWCHFRAADVSKNSVTGPAGVCLKMQVCFLLNYDISSPVIDLHEVIFSVSILKTQDAHWQRSLKWNKLNSIWSFFKVQTAALNEVCHACKSSKSRPTGDAEIKALESTVSSVKSALFIVRDSCSHVWLQLTSTLSLEACVCYS